MLYPVDDFSKPIPDTPQNIYWVLFHAQFHGRSILEYDVLDMANVECSSQSGKRLGPASS